MIFSMKKSLKKIHFCVFIIKTVNILTFFVTFSCFSLHRLYKMTNLLTKYEKEQT